MGSLGQDSRTESVAQNKKRKRAIVDDDDEYENRPTKRESLSTQDTRPKEAVQPSPPLPTVAEAATTTQVTQEKTKKKKCKASSTMRWVKLLTFDVARSKRRRHPKGSSRSGEMDP